MKKLTILGIVLVLSLQLFSQDSKETVVRKERIVGRNLKTNKPIKGINYYFSRTIHAAYMDTISHNLSVQLCKVFKSGKLKNKGKLLVCNMEDGKVMWEKKIYFHTCNVQQCGNNIIHTIDHDSYCLKANTGKEAWHTMNNLKYIDEISKIGIGYKYKDFIGYPNIIQGLRLDDGKLMWERKIKKEYGWNDIIALDDSVRLFVAAGLHTVNMKDGKGWDYNAMTGEENYTLSDALMTDMAGTLATRDGGISSNTVSGIVSNPIITDKDIYIASRYKISRINKKDGKVIWSNKLNGVYSSKSSIFIENGVLYMVNHGFAYFRNKKIGYGIPFIAAYDLTTGKRKYHYLVNLKFRDIHGFNIKGDKIALLFNDKVKEYFLETGERVLEKEIDIFEHGALKNFVGDNVYAYNKQNELISVSNFDISYNYIFSDKKTVLICDSKYNIKDKLDYRKLSVCNLETDKIKFIASGNKMIVVNKEGDKLAELFVSNKTMIVGNKLIDMQGQCLLMVDLSDIILHQ